MLADPLTIRQLSLAAHTAITAIQTLSFPRVERDGVLRYELAGIDITGADETSAGVSTLRIGQSTSNEQKPVLTKRTLVRLDVPFLGTDGKVYNNYNYNVSGVAQTTMISAFDGTSVVPQSTIALKLMEIVLGVLAVNTASSALDETKFNRIIAGET